MHITKIELENIKSHADSTFEFSPGSTAITGENGAGKTTLIEAVAWTLFDILDYKKEDFARRGTKKGTARVTFESSLDERLYTVYRDTGTGYYVFDPGLKTRIADKKEEVLRFLWQHLGVEPGTDLPSLFKQAIGVPQGTLTAIFLATATERKKVFDALLKVEEYRRGADELLRTQRFIEQQIAFVREKVARSEGELSRFETVEAELAAAERDAGTLRVERAEIGASVTAKQVVVAGMDTAEAKLAERRSAVEKLGAERAKAEIILRQREAEFQRSRDAAVTIEKVRASAEQHTAALGRIHELERERVERDRINNELAQVESAETAVLAEQKHLIGELTKIAEAHKSIELLRPAAAEQEEVEKQLGHLQLHVANARAAAKQVKSIEDRLARMRATYREHNEQLEELRKQAKDAESLEQWQTRDSEIVREIAGLQASLERDQKFQSEIKNGLCPILSEKCLNLKEGETLEGFVSNQFEDLKSRIDLLETEHGSVAAALRASRQAEKSAVQAATVEKRLTEISDEARQLKAEKEGIEGSNGDLADIERHLSEAEKKLKTLDNPKARLDLLESESRREGDLREAFAKTEKNLERLRSDKRLQVERLESYKDLDMHWTQAASTRDETADAYRSFVANEEAANALRKKEKEFEAAKGDLATADQKLKAELTELETADKGYDPARHLSEKAALLELQKREAEMTARLDAAERAVERLTTELGRLNEVRKAMQAEYREKERLEKVAETTTFIRDTLKEAAPLVARNYVYHVSLEASQMFREITGNAERTLKWSEDYGIQLEEGGYERPFQNLSGGEQMAAALSVRLALLKQLSDIRLAFFDEPTTNMDAERRENLAQQIGQIKHFDQLWVISHDDTFEGYMDHEIRVERN